MQMKALLFVVLCGILCVKATPFHPDSSIDLLKLNEVQEQLQFNLNNVTLSTLSSNETLEVVKPEDNSPIAPEISVESTVVVESIPDKVEDNHSHGLGNVYGHGEQHVSSNIGPVELGLRNVVSASGIATEELFMEMAALMGKTSEMIHTKSEILTSHAMNDIFKPLSMTEAEIKKNPECGKQFVSSYNAILSHIDSSLKTCSHNLTIIGENYKNQSTQILSGISIIAEEIQNLPESCEIAQNFAVGTFCTINNLAEANTRVVMCVKDVRYITALAKENITKAASSTVACHNHLVGVVLEKLKKLFKEIGEKCNQQSQLENNEIKNENVNLHVE